MLISFISANFLSIWMLFIKLTTAQSEAQKMKMLQDVEAGLTDNRPKVQPLSQEALLILQTAVMVFPLLPLSLAIEDWTVFLVLDPAGWAMLFAFGFFVFAISNYINVLAIKIMGPTATSSVLAWRLGEFLFFSFGALFITCKLLT